MSMRFWKPNQYAIFLNPLSTEEEVSSPQLFIADTDNETWNEKFIDNKTYTHFVDIICLLPEKDLIMYKAEKKRAFNWDYTVNVYCSFLDKITY